MKISLLFALFFISIAIYAQDTRAFNQNASRSNHSPRAFNQNASRSNHSRLGISVSPVISLPSDGSGSDTLLLRGNGAGAWLGVDYFFSKIGISFTSGFTTGSVSSSKLDNFINNAGLPRDQVTSRHSRSLSTCFLIGPSFRTGNKLTAEANIKAGVFFNNPGLIDIREKAGGAIVYRTDPGNSNANTGFATGIKLLYSIHPDWGIGLMSNYIQSSTNLTSFDIRRRNEVNPIPLKNKTRDFLVGLNITYNIRRCNDPAPQTRAQNNNTVRSNRTDNAYRTSQDSTPNSQPQYRVMLVEADFDGDGVYESDITRKVKGKILVDANGEITEAHQQKAGVSTSRSNIPRASRNGLEESDSIPSPQTRAGVSTSRSNIRTHINGILIDDNNDLVVSYGSFDIKARGNVPVRVVSKITSR